MRALIIAVIVSSVISFGAIGASVVADNYANTQLLAADGSQPSEGRAAYESLGSTLNNPGNDFGPGFDNVAPTTAGKSNA